MSKSIACQCFGRGKDPGGCKIKYKYNNLKDFLLCLIRILPQKNRFGFVLLSLGSQISDFHQTKVECRRIGGDILTALNEKSSWAPITLASIFDGSMHIDAGPIYYHAVVVHIIQRVV